MKGKFVALAMALLVMSSMVVAGCGAMPETVVSERSIEVVEKEVVKEVVVTPTPAVPAVKRIQELHVAQFGNPASLSCWDWGTGDALDIAQHFGEPLFTYDHDGNVVGVLVESWESEEPTEWTFHIRKGLKFHDPAYGELKADDVVASLEACFNADATMLAIQPNVILEMELEIVDDYTVKVKFPEPGAAGLPNSWTLTVITSKEYLEQVGEDYSRFPMGTGPFKFIEWVPNVRLVGERFQDYWGEGPGAERIVWRIIPDPFTRKSEFLTGGLDILPFLMADWVPEVDANPDVRLEKVLSSRFIFIMLPVKQPPFNDIRVRKALNYAVNKQEMVDQLFQEIGAVPMTGIIHMVLPEADPDRVGYPYDPEKAKQLLDEARADGVEIGTLTLYAPNDRYNMDKEMGEAVAGYWRAVGLDVEYIPQSRTVLFPKVQALESKDPALFGNGNGSMRAEYPFNVWLYTRTDPPSRGSEYAVGPPEWDEMVDELGSMASGSPEASKLGRELDELWTDYAPWVFLVNFVDLYGVSNEVDWTPYSTEDLAYSDAWPAE